MKLQFRKGMTSVRLRVWILDSSKSDGSGLTGLTSASSGLTAAIILNYQTTATAMVLEGIAALGTFATPSGSQYLRFAEVSGMGGLYELQIDNSWFVGTNGDSLHLFLTGAANMVPCPIEIQLLPAVDDVNLTQIEGVALDTGAAELHLALLQLNSPTGSSLVIQSDTVDAPAVLVTTTNDAQGVLFSISGENAAIWAEGGGGQVGRGIVGGLVGDVAGNLTGDVGGTVTGLAASISALVARLGAFTGTGLNTVLGFFHALLRKDAALTPSDVGGTYDNTTDSLEAQADAGGGGGGLTAAEVGAAVWDGVDYTGTRTLTPVTTPPGTDPVPNQLDIYQASTWSQAINGLGNISSATKLWFTVKKKYSDADAEALVQIELAAGLLCIDGDPPVSVNNGSITIVDAVLGNIVVDLDEAETSELEPRDTAVCDVKMLKAGDVSSLMSGTVVIHPTVTRAIV